MAYPDFSHPFVLHCDASEDGLGAVLYQEQENKLRVISYASRTLTPAEKNYYLHSGKLEFLALKWAVTEKFKDYLYYALSFTVYSDCNPLSYVLTSAKLNATTIRWVGELADYNFNVKYRPGKCSVDCDYLSKCSVDGIGNRIENCTEEMNQEMIDAVMTESRQKGKYAAINSYSSDALGAPDVGKLVLSQITPVEVVEAQMNDPIIGKVYQLVKEKRYPDHKMRKEMATSVKALVKQWNRLKLNDDDVLVREISDRVQLVLPEKYRDIVIEELHVKMGHLCAERVSQLVQERFYWPYMCNHIQHYVSKVCQCIKSKKPNRQPRAPLVNIQCSEPFELISIDYLHLDKCKGGYEYLLVVVDHFSRFVQAYPTRNNGGRTAADKIFNEFVLKFGFPKRLHHDRGREFENNLFKRFHELSGVEASRTTPYHPQGEGQGERMNRTILNMLKTLPEVYKSNWKDHVNKLTFAYNCTRNDATSFSPFKLLFGRSPRLPIDLMFNLHPEKKQMRYDEYVDTWERAMREAYNVAEKNAFKNSARGKKYHDKKVFGATLKIGDRVLVRNLSERGGTGKLRSFWEQKVHKVVGKKDEHIPVYTIRPEDGSGKERIIHKNLLLLCDYLPVEEPVSSVNKKRKVRKRKDAHVKGKSDTKIKKNIPINESSSDSSEEEDCFRRYQLLADKLPNAYGVDGVSDGDNEQIVLVMMV